MEKLKSRCPKCQNYIQGYPAISRKDNKTKICSKCGILEALESFINYQRINETIFKKGECENGK